MQIYRMLNTFSYGSNFSQLPKRDNLHIKDKRPAPNLSVIRKFYCILKEKAWSPYSNSARFNLASLPGRFCVGGKNGTVGACVLTSVKSQ